MKLTLKKVSTNAALSDETTCFSADVYVDGKKAGCAENRGCGGATNVHFADRAVEAAVRAWATPTVPEEFRKFSDPIEWAVDKLVDEHLKAGEEKRIARAEAKEVARLQSVGCIAVLRFRVGDNIRWVGVPKGQTAEVALAKMTAKYGAIAEHLTAWEAR